MGYKKVISIIIISIVIILALIFVFNFTMLKHFENKAKNILTITQEAIDQKNPEKCKEIDEEREKNVCYVVVANATNNFSICSRIFWVHYPAYVYSCYSQGALVNNDESYCKKIEEIVELNNLTSDYYNGDLNPSACFISLAIQRKDKSICDLISGVYDESGSDKDYCYALVSSSK